jgi:hypothetical protein
VRWFVIELCTKLCTELNEESETPQIPKRMGGAECLGSVAGAAQVVRPARQENAGAPLAQRAQFSIFVSCGAECAFEFFRRPHVMVWHTDRRWVPSSGEGCDRVGPARKGLHRRTRPYLRGFEHQSSLSLQD